MQVGILALQGCVTPHVTHFSKLGCDTLPVRSSELLWQCDALVLPGGESSTMLHLLKRANLFSEVIKFCSSRPVWGICAGSILLAKEVSHPEQESFGIMDIHAERNAYGSQLDSFKAEISVNLFDSPLLADFIRAPRLCALSDTVECLAEYHGDGVLFRQGHLLASSFHTELTEDSRLHQCFLEFVH
ncbi:MAG: pyridoxal 5'-phosphate synthase glutaminase subunit PdxT [Bdellovibrionales bacterium]|nr:pyridoxal 5'-phosphate synthase glutaminase subunit PdxT [Bdellovibrionales bacterium]